MSELTQEEKYYRSKRRSMYLTWGLVIAALAAIFFLWQGCRKSKNQQLAYDQIKDTLQSVLNDTARVKAEAARLKSENQQLDSALADAIADRDMIQGALIDESDKSERLLKQLEIAKNKGDTRAVALIADTCCVDLSFVRFRVESMVKSQKMTDSLYALRVKTADSLGNHWKRSYDSCKSAVAFAVAELPKVKPKGKLYLDVTGQTGALTALGGGIGYMDASGRIISLDYLISGHGPIYQLRLSAPLSFKRK